MCVFDTQLRGYPASTYLYMAGGGARPAALHRRLDSYDRSIYVL